MSQKPISELRRRMLEEGLRVQDLLSRRLVTHPARTRPPSQRSFTSFGASYPDDSGFLSIVAGYHGCEYSDWLIRPVSGRLRGMKSRAATVPSWGE